MSYRCKNCGSTLDTPFCIQCNSPDNVVSVSASSQASTGNTAATASTTSSGPVLVPYQQPATQHGFAGLDALEGTLERGRRAIMMLGLSNSGKSQIVRAFTQEAAKHHQVTALEVSRILFEDGPIGGTTSGTIWYQQVDIDGRHYVFVDPSGEDLKFLLPQVGGTSTKVLSSATIDPTRLLLLHKASKRLDALVVVVDMLRTPASSIYPWSRQEEQLAWLLRVVRWLRADTPDDAVDFSVGGKLGLISHIDDRAPRVAKIDVPVQVLFSKADRLPIETTRQRPLYYARTHLPTLHAALTSHTREFRYDFISTMHESPDRKTDIPSDRPWGVFLSFEWLLFDSYRRFGKLPARWLMYGGSAR
jgi:hypothetical protein